MEIIAFLENIEIQLNLINLGIENTYLKILIS